MARLAYLGRMHESGQLINPIYKRRSVYLAERCWPRLLQAIDQHADLVEFFGVTHEEVRQLRNSIAESLGALKSDGVLSQLDVVGGCDTSGDVEGGSGGSSSARGMSLPQHLFFFTLSLVAAVMFSTAFDSTNMEWIGGAFGLIWGLPIAFSGLFGTLGFLVLGRSGGGTEIDPRADSFYNQWAEDRGVTATIVERPNNRRSWLASTKLDSKTGQVTVEVASWLLRSIENPLLTNCECFCWRLY